MIINMSKKYIINGAALMMLMAEADKETVMAIEEGIREVEE